MALFNCRACGAPLEVREGTEIAFCPYCGMKQTLPKDPVQVMSDGTSVDSLLKRAFMFLEDGNWEKANEYCDRVLDIEPKNARAYLGKLMVDLRVRKMDDLAREEKPFDNNNNYEKVLRFGDEGLISELRGHNATVALTDAVYHNRIYTVETLLRAGANVNAKNKKGSTALTWAAYLGRTEIVNAMLNAEADVNAKTKQVNTALMWAAFGGCTETVNALLEAGADVNAKNKKGSTALMEAASYGNTEIVNILLNAGADVNNANGDTALMCAAAHGSKEIVNILLKAGADVNAKGDYGWTALMEAAYGGHTEIVNILLNAGADVNAKDNKGQTALDLAKKEAHKETVNVLKRLSPTQATGCMTLILQALTVIIIITILAVYL